MIGVVREELPDEVTAIVREDPHTGRPVVVVDSRLPKDEAGAAARAAWRAYRDSRPRRRVWGTGAVLVTGALALAGGHIWRILRRYRSHVATAVVAATGAATVTGLVIGHGSNDNGTHALPGPPTPSAAPTAAAPPSPGPSPHRQPDSGPTRAPGHAPSFKSPTSPHPTDPKATTPRSEPAVPPFRGHPSPRISPPPAGKSPSTCLLSVQLLPLADARLLCEQAPWSSR